MRCRRMLPDLSLWHRKSLCAVDRLPDIIRSETGGSMPSEIRSLESMVIGTMMSMLVAVLPSTVCHADQSTGIEHIGTTATILRDVESSWKGSDRSTGSSTDRDALVERVTGLRGDDLEIEYDLPAWAKEQDRARIWQFPVRVLRKAQGQFQLLNGPELEARLNAWLVKAGLPQAVCGHSYVTWNVFKIECDPQSMISVVEQYDLRFANLHDGTSYTDREALGPMILIRMPTDSSDYVFTGTAPVDPEQLRREQAQSDVVDAEVANENSDAK